MGKASALLRTDTGPEHQFLSSDSEATMYGFPTTTEEKRTLLERLMDMGPFAIKGADIAVAVADIMAGRRKPCLLASWGTDDAGQERIYNRPFIFDREVGGSWGGFSEVFPRVAAAQGISTTLEEFDAVLESEEPREYAFHRNGSLLVAQSVLVAVERDKMPEAYANPDTTIVFTVETRTDII